MLREPLKHVDKDNVWFAKALLLKGGAYPNQDGVEEDIGKGSVHGDDVSPCFLELRACFAQVVVWSFSLVQLVQSSTSPTGGGIGVKASGYASTVKNP